MNHKEEAQLWKEFKEQGDPWARVRLIEAYAKLPEVMAHKLCLKLPKYVDVNDMAGEGTLGLIEAVDKFDPQRGLRFPTYAGRLIHGRMIDAIRRGDHVPRTTRDRGKAAQQLREQGVSDDEANSAVRLTEQQRALLRLRIHSLADVLYVSGAGREACRGDIVAGLAPHEGETRAARCERLEQIMHGLRLDEKVALYLYYNCGRTMAEIGAAMNLSESRISQYVSAALEWLRKHRTPQDSL